MTQASLAPPQFPQPYIPPPAAGPVGESERLETIDILRGFALLGILVLNIQAFAMPGAAYMNPTAYGDFSGANYWVWYLSHVLADQKFMTIFSMLFGAGIVLMTSRIEATGQSSAGVHYRRMGWLILFGLLHAHLLWYGDILYFYGICGMVAWLFRRMKPWLLLVLGLVAVSVASVIFIGFGAMLTIAPPEAVQGANEGWLPTPEQMASEIAAYRGGWLDQMSVRPFAALMFETFMLAIWGGWRAGGLMLIGMAFFSWGVFSGRCSKKVYLAFIAVAVLLGIPATMLEVRLHHANHWQALKSMFFISQIHYWASLLVSLGWIGVVMLLARLPRARPALWPLAAVGRTALSNYLLQTIICTFIFYGHGLGYFGQVERVGQFAVVVTVWVVQLIASVLWLRYFQYGPFEWLWRCLTYVRIEPIVRRPAPAAPVDRPVRVVAPSAESATEHP